MPHLSGFCSMYSIPVKPISHWNMYTASVWVYIRLPELLWIMYHNQWYPCGKFKPCLKSLWSNDSERIIGVLVERAMARGACWVYMLLTLLYKPDGDNRRDHQAHGWAHTFWKTCHRTGPGRWHSNTTPHLSLRMKADVNIGWNIRYINVCLCWGNVYIHIFHTKLGKFL